MYSLLIVDDEVQILEGIRRTLDWQALSIGPVVTAQTYHAAIGKAVEMEPDLALFDVCLGERRGYELIEKLQELKLPTHYLMMSGYEEFEFVRRAMACGAKGYLLKPIDRRELQDALCRIIREELGGLPQEEQVAKDPVLDRPYEDFSKLTRKMLVMASSDYGDTLTLKEVGERFRMNSTYLGQIFLRDTGMKFSEYVTRFRLLTARRLIEETDDKVGVIAYQVGYRNMGYFYTQFREMFSLSPLDLRWHRRKGEEAP